MREKIGEPKVGMVNGKAAFTRYGDYGSQQNVAGVTPPPEFMTIDRGGSSDVVNKYNLPSAGQSFGKTMSPDSIASNKLGYAHLAETQRHNQLTEGDPAMIEQAAQGIAAGNLAPLSGFALARPMGQSVMARVMQINPEYSAADFGTAQKALKEFTSGKAGNQVRSFNVALAHLDTLQAASDALKNGDMIAFNKVGNYFQQQSGSPLPNNFNAVKTIVGNEIVKAIVGSGGGVEDRDKAARAVDAANSPAQLKGVIGQYKDLMKGQLNGLRQQYEASTKRKDFNKFLSPEALQTMGVGGSQSDVRSQADAILGIK